MPGRPNGWWISPAVPTIANCALALLWIFSALGGWGDSAFCGDEKSHDAICAADFEDAVLFSIPVAVLAAALAITAWATPAIRHHAGRLDALLGIAAMVWVLGEAVLFVGGYLAQS